MPGQAADLGHHLHQCLHILQDRALQLQETQAASATGLRSHRGLWLVHMLQRSLAETPRTTQSLWLGSEHPVEGREGSLHQASSYHAQTFKTQQYS